MDYTKQTEWNKANTTAVKLKLNNRTDADIIQHLDTVDNKQGYIKQLIRQDINGQAAQTAEKG